MDTQINGKLRHAEKGCKEMTKLLIRCINHKNWITDIKDMCVIGGWGWNFSPLLTEIPLYHILNARITFSNLNGCEEGAGVRADNEVVVEGERQRDTPRTDTPSPGSDSSSVSSSSSTSKRLSCRMSVEAFSFTAPQKNVIFFLNISVIYYMYIFVLIM